LVEVGVEFIQQLTLLVETEVVVEAPAPKVGQLIYQVVKVSIQAALI
jgi:hypothetical protein